MQSDCAVHRPGSKKGDRLNKIDYLLFKTELRDKIEGFRAPASLGLSKAPDIFSNLRIVYKSLSHRLAKLGAFACLHKTIPGKIFVELVQRDRREGFGARGGRLHWETGASR